MKKLLGLLFLGLLLSSNAYAPTITNCEVESGEISGEVDNIYQCVSGDTFVLDEGQSIVGLKDRIDLEQNSGAEGVVINNWGWIESTKGGSNAISGEGSDTVTLNNKSTGTIKSPNAIFIGAGSNWEIDNYGDIYSTSAKAINIRGGDNTKITNRSDAKIRTDEQNAILMQDSASDDPSETLTLDNYGSVSAKYNAVKIAVNSTGATINNYSGATIEATDSAGTNNNYKGAIRIDVNDVTVVNKGSLIGLGASSSIRLDDNVTGTKIYVDETASFTGEIHLGNNTSASNSTLYLGCNISQDITIEVKKKSKATITNNLCGNDTLTILDNSEDSDPDNSETNGYLVIDEGLEVVSNNASYRRSAYYNPERHCSLHCPS